MKFNWGTGIAVVLTLFVGGMMWTFFNTGNHQQELVVSEYYNKEGDAIDRANHLSNAREVGAELTTNLTEEALELTIPDVLVHPESTGQVVLYYPTAAAHDQTLSWPAGAQEMRIQRSALAPGRCILRVTISRGGKSYLLEKNLLL